MSRDSAATLSVERFLAPAWRAALAGIVSAVMLAAAYSIFSPFRLRWMAWIGLVPLLLATQGRARHRQVYPIVVVWVVTYVFGVADLYYLRRLVPASMLPLVLALIWAMMVAEIQLFARWFRRWRWLLVPCMWTGALFLISLVIPVLWDVLPHSFGVLVGSRSVLLQEFSVTNGLGLVFVTVLVNSGLAELISRLEHPRWWGPIVVVFIALGVIGVIRMRPVEDWERSRPEAQGMSSERLSGLRAHIEERLPHIRSVLIVRHGHIVFEEYFQGQNQSDYNHLGAVTESFTSALIGIALREGYLDSLDERLVDFYPEYVTPDLDPKIKDVTVEHLLTMTSGLVQDAYTAWTVSDDWNRSAMELPVLYEPGQRFHYSNSAAHLISGILTKATGMSPLEFADAFLFRPLGVKKRQWGTDPQENNVGAVGLSLRARDMAKLGYLYLNQGTWDGKDIIPPDYARASTQEHTEGGFPELEGYGYLWWVTAIEGQAAFFAGGYGGQYIYVIPGLDIVVVITSNSEGAHLENRAVISDFVIPAISG